MLYLPISTTFYCFVIPPWIIYLHLPDQLKASNKETYQMDGWMDGRISLKPQIIKRPWKVKFYNKHSFVPNMLRFQGFLKIRTLNSLS